MCSSNDFIAICRARQIRPASGRRHMSAPGTAGLAFPRYVATRSPNELKQHRYIGISLEWISEEFSCLLTTITYLRKISLLLFCEIEKNCIKLIS